jgi:glycosyltransferase involved in cell wall biosynthesis
MRILYLAMESSNWVINLCNKFCELGNTVTCIIQTLDDYDKENPLPEHEDLKVIRIPYAAFTTPLVFEKTVLPKIRDDKYDIVFGSHTPVSPIAQALANMYKIPYGIMILDIPTDLMRNERWRMMQWEFWFPILKTANTIIFNTHVARDEYEKYTHQYFPDDFVIPYGTNFPEKHRKSGKDIKGDYVISVCRLTKLKNCSLIPKALSHLSSIKKYVAIGRDCGELKEIKELCDKHVIEFEHYSEISEDKKYELIRDSAMMIYPQSTEYIGGLAPFEAMWVNKPVLVPNLKVLRELYSNFPIYFDNNDELDLAESISFIYALRESIKYKLVHNADMYAESVASYDKMAKDMLKIMEKVL